MKTIELHTLEEITNAVDNGFNVYANSALYKVIKNSKNDEYLIKSNNHSIGLTDDKGNLNASKFFTIK